jgi:perosamine synthetase
MILNLFNIQDIYDIKNICPEYTEFVNGNIDNLQDVETTLHKRFYEFIKSKPDFKNTYTLLLQDILHNLFPTEQGFVFQTFPSIRFQFPGNKAIPPHCDSDELGKHPIGERNFLLPVTEMKNTTRLFVESTPGAKDFEGINLDYGELLYFNGNKCVHYNEKNTESYVRISFDFRVLTFKDYITYCNSSKLVYTNPRDGKRTPTKMLIGGYYQCMFKNEPVVYRTIENSILQTRPSFNDAEADACYQYFKDGDPFLTEFKKTQELENQLKVRIGVNHCFMVPSGTSAIITALIACGISPGDEVILPNYTMIATANAVRILGAVPVLVDVDSKTFTMRSVDINAAITEKTRAVIHVSLNNRSSDIHSIVALCNSKSLFLIEDAAQSLGCRYDGQHYGTFGDIGCFSLSTPKIITTGQGGFLITNNDSLSKKILKIKNFGRTSGGSEEYDSFGVNFKFTDIQAVIGLAQLHKLDGRVARMREIFNTYHSQLSRHSNVSMISPDDPLWFPWFVEILLDSRERTAKFLSDHNVQTRITYPTVESIIRNTVSNSFPNSDYISKHGLYLPSHLLLSENDITNTCNLIRIINT